MDKVEIFLLSLFGIIIVASLVTTYLKMKTPLTTSYNGIDLSRDPRIMLDIHNKPKNNPHNEVGDIFIYSDGISGTKYEWDGKYWCQTNKFLYRKPYC